MRSHSGNVASFSTNGVVVIEPGGAIEDSGSGIRVATDDVSITKSAGALTIPNEAIVNARLAGPNQTLDPANSVIDGGSGDFPSRTGKFGTLEGLGSEGTDPGTPISVHHAPRTALDIAYNSGITNPLLINLTTERDFSFVMRWHVHGEAAGGSNNQVSKASNATALGDFYWVVGIGFVGTGAGTSTMQVVTHGTYNLTVNDTPFNVADIGKPVYLDAAGGFTVTRPVATTLAVFILGTVKTTTSIWVDRHFIEINP